MSTHAKRSPSGIDGWSECAGWQSDGTGSKFSFEGTDAHQLAALVLTDGVHHAEAYRGRAMDNGNVVDDEMILAVQEYVDYVLDVAKAAGGELLVEQRLPIDSITGEEGANGTSDAVILADTELVIADLKYGRGVPVSAEGNGQLRMYGLAALREYSLARDYKTVRMVIHQPRLGAVSEAVMTAEELEAFGDHVKARIAHHDANPDARNPGPKQCRWCAAKATCPALQDEVLGMFDNVQPDADTPAVDLGAVMAKAEMVEAWLKAIRAETETRLLAGLPVPGFKLVQGKRGNRKWADEKAAEELLKAMRIKHDQMFDYSVISPASAEKLAKADVIGPRQWPKVAALITQTEGKPSVAPESDKRPALVMSAAAADFDDVTDLA